MFMKPLPQRFHSLQTVKPETGSYHIKIPSLILLHKQPQWQHARTKQPHNDAQGKHNQPHVFNIYMKKRILLIHTFIAEKYIFC